MTPVRGADPADVVIVGGGPVGLTLACALADQGFRVTVAEAQMRAALAEPPPDGRDIALTHRSAAILDDLGLLQRLPSAELARIREARVLDTGAAGLLHFEALGAGRDFLGYLIGNHLLRRATFDGAAARPAVTLLDGVKVARLESGDAQAQVVLADGRALAARLVVGADSRLSEARRQMGIGAELRQFGRDVIVCRMSHEAPSDGIAWECFGYDETLAVLPLNGRQVSTVVTVTSDRTGALMQLAPARYAAWVRERFGARLGALQPAGERHAYPLVAVYAQRFVARRFALAGDAAVGMHPVTAHGFNLGLYGVEALARALAGARAAGRDIGGLDALAPYERTHRRATRPLYLGTNALVRLYTDARAPARVVRAAVIGLAERLPVLKAAITHQLTGPGAR